MLCAPGKMELTVGVASVSIGLYSLHICRLDDKRTDQNILSVGKL